MLRLTTSEGILVDACGGEAIPKKWPVRTLVLVHRGA
jgi:hypothetical protein